MDHVIWSGLLFEVIEVKGGHMVKEWDFEVEKKIKINVKKKSNFELCFYVIWPFSYLKWVKK